MNIKLKSIIILVILLLITSIYSEETSEWYAFSISKNIDTTSMFNIGKIILDSPCGKHGFVKVKNGRLYFEDETKCKFWGTNLTHASCFPTNEEAVMIADRIAFFGFNIVRFHLIDSKFEPEGIFKDTNPGNSDIQAKKTGIFSETQFNRLDYFIYQLKLRGIYIYLDLLDGRNFTLADGVIKADELLMAAKPVSLFDTTLIRLQKLYAKEFLTHYNAYTKFQYFNDPSIALIEITNENSMFITNQNTHFIPDYYQSILNTMYTDWLKTNSGTINEFYSYLGKKYFDEMTVFLKNQNEIGVKVPITGIAGYLKSEDLQVQESCDFIDTHIYWDHPSFPVIRWDKNNFAIRNGSLFTTEHDEERAFFINTLTTRNPKTKPYILGEWNQPYPNQYSYDFPLFIASEGLKDNWDGLLQFGFSNGWDTKFVFNDLNYFFFINSNPQQLILNAMGSLFFLKTNNVESNIVNNTLIINSSIIQAAVGFIKDRTIILGDFTITPDQNGAVVIYKNPTGFLFMALSEIKNTESGWNQEGKFVWGNSPVLLKKINVDVKISSNDKQSVYEYDEQGSRKRKLSTTFSNNVVSFSTNQSLSPWFEIAKSPSILPYSTTLVLDETMQFTISGGIRPFIWSIDDTTSAYINNGLLIPKSNIDFKSDYICYIKIVDQFGDADSSKITILYDNDKDKLPDAWELLYNINIYDPNGDNGWYGDIDRDGLINGEELLYGFDPSDLSSPSPPSAPSFNDIGPKNNFDKIISQNPWLSVNNSSYDTAESFYKNIRYSFEIYSDAGLTQLYDFSSEISEGKNTTLWTVSKSLMENTNYWWRAKSYIGNLKSAWMTPILFTVDIANNPPTKPKNSYPPDKSEVSTTYPKLEITNASDPEDDILTYEFNLYDPDRTVYKVREIPEGSNGITQWNVQYVLKNNVWYYWESRAVDENGEQGEWMDRSSFLVNTSNNPPSVPELVSPLNTSEIITQTPYLIINNSKDLEGDKISYFFEIDTTNTFSSPNLEVSEKIVENISNNYTSWQTSQLKDNTFWYWRVHSYDGKAYCTTWTNGMFFVNTENDPPSQPVLLAPTEISINILNPEFKIYSYDIDFDNIKYDYKIFDTSGNIINSITDADSKREINLPFTNNHKYYWQAQAKDEHGLESGWSEKTWFIYVIGNSLPTAPILIRPKRKSIITNTQTPELIIANSSDIDKDPLIYHFQVFDDVKLSDIPVAENTQVIEGSNETTSWQVNLILLDKTYWWRVQAYDGIDYGPWSITSSFIIKVENSNFNSSTNNIKKKEKKICLITRTIETDFNSSYIIAFLNRFKDKYLLDFEISRCFIDLYYKLSSNIE